MSDVTTVPPGPGWYADPTDATSTRYWDGGEWTVHRTPPSPINTPGMARTSGFAVASLVLGILWIWGIGSVLAIVFGAKAQKEIDASDGVVSGRGMASWGLWLGIIGAVGFVLILLAVAVSEPDAGVRVNGR